MFSFSQHYFYSVNLLNGQQIVYYEEDETNKGDKQGVFLFLKEKHLFQSLTERMAILFQCQVPLLFFLWVFYVFCFSMDKERAAALSWGCLLWGLTATSVSGQGPHGKFWLQGGKAGKIPKCIEANFQLKFSPRFLLVPYLESFYWMCPAFRSALPVESGGPGTRWIFRSSTSCHGLHRNFQLPKWRK